jgi:hypothetical protein
VQQQCHAKLCQSVYLCANCYWLDDLGNDPDRYWTCWIGRFRVYAQSQTSQTDLEPFNRSTGGMIQDALEEIPAIQGLAGALREVVKVRCRNCNALSDKHAKLCGQCGKAL